MPKSQVPSTLDDDDRWLARLRGEPVSGPANSTDQQARAIRQALLRDADPSSNGVGTDELAYQRLLTRLRTESGTQAQRPFAAKPQFWGVAATLLVAIGVAMQMLNPLDNPAADATRGSGSLVVDDAKALSNELSSVFGALDSEPEIYTWCDGVIEVRALPTTETLNYLLEAQNLVPVIRHGYL